MEENKQEAEVVVENQRDGMRWELESVLPQGEAEGFFLLRCVSASIRQAPNRVREITLSLSNGATFRMVVVKEPVDFSNSLEAALAGFIKKLVEENSALVNVEGPGQPYILFKDLCLAFNTELGYDERRQIKAKTATEICRDTFGLGTYRFAKGWALLLETGRLCKMANRFKLGEMNFSLPPGKDFIDWNLNQVNIDS